MMKLKNPTDNIVYAIIAGFCVKFKFLANSKHLYKFEITVP